MELFSDSLAGHTAALLGFGISAQQLLPYLLRCGMRVCVRDRRTAPPAALPAGVSYRGGEGYLDDLREEYLFRSPSLRPDLPPLAASVARGAVLSSEWGLFAARTPATVLGVTGSDGKTTTATLAAEMLRAGGIAGRRVFLGGNIGVPLTPFLPDMRAEDYAVAELSSFQLMDAPPAPARAVVTNLTENHLNWHRDMAEYTAAKANILGAATHAVLNAESPAVAAMAKGRAEKTLFSSRRGRAALLSAFGECHTVTVEEGNLAYDGEALFPATTLRLPGVHNLENCMAAIGLVYPCLADRDAMRRVALQFSGVRHRLERVGCVCGVTYYNSSIDSTPTRTAAALAALGGKPIILCGGADKGVSFAPLRAALSSHVKAAILFGATREKLFAVLRGADFPCYQRETLSEAVRLAAELALPGDRVLLSPACTSFDAYANFEERGDAFCRTVAALSRDT